MPNTNYKKPQPCTVWHVNLHKYKEKQLHGEADGKQQKRKRKWIFGIKLNYMAVSLNSVPCIWASGFNLI